MQNPWTALPERAPYVLPQDAELIKRHNQHVDPSHQIHLEVLPEPYLGSIDAPILLLNANPGFSSETVPFFTQPVVYAQCRSNLLHQTLEYPFCLLDPTLDTTASGARWWSQKLKPLIEIAGRKQVATQVCGIEFLPYRSPKFKPLADILPSQRYSFYLVSQALKRNAIVILMRSERFWRSFVPELNQYDHLFVLRNPQNVMISRNNCPDAFPFIMQALLGYDESASKQHIQNHFKTSQGDTMDQPGGS